MSIKQAVEQEYHSISDPHKRGSILSDIILGGQDGLVNVLGVVLGVTAATSDLRVIFAAGLAATFAESVSMAAVAYTSTLADADFYESEREREYRHLRMAPTIEREEIQRIYEQKGFEGDLLDRIVATITQNPDVWVAVMMAEEHQLRPIDRKYALRSALIVGLSAIIGSLIPLAPFFVLPLAVSSWAAVFIAALVLFGVGAYKAHTTIGHPIKSGVEMALIGTISALVGYGIGLLFSVTAP